MTITLTIVLLSFISNSALTSTIKNVTDKIDISIYLSDTVTSDQVNNLQNRLRQNPDVASVRYVSKADALAEWRKQHTNDQKLLQATSETDNPLPASFAVRAKDPKKLDSITNFVTEPGVAKLLDAKEPISYSGKNKTTIDRIVSFSSFFKKSGLIISAIFVIVSILIIFNTIRMAIFTRKDEIEIMKLVGATKWFIRGPFLFEAAFYGIIAALIGVALSYILLFAGGPRIQGYIDLGTAIGFFQNSPVLVIGTAMCIGILIGVTSSLLALSRYLRL